MSEVEAVGSAPIVSSRSHPTEELPNVLRVCPVLDAKTFADSVVSEECT